jgi:hypothetical protein
MFIWWWNCISLSLRFWDSGNHTDGLDLFLQNPARFYKIAKRQREKQARKEIKTFDKVRHLRILWSRHTINHRILHSLKGQKFFIVHLLWKFQESHGWSYLASYFCWRCPPTSFHSRICMCLVRGKTADILSIDLAHVPYLQFFSTWMLQLRREKVAQKIRIDILQDLNETMKRM